MKANQIIEKVLDKWPVKLICLAVAIFLYVFHQVSLVETKTFTVPLTVVEEGNMVHTNDIQKFVSVVITANREEISTIHTTDINAYVTLDYQIEKGTFDFPVTIDLTERILSLDPLEIKVKPENVSVTCDSKMTKYIPVEVSMVGDPAYGYELSDVTIEPGVIEISGPETLVQNTTKIQTSQVVLTDANKNFTTKTSYINLNPNISFDKSTSFEVDVNIKPIISEKSYSEIPITVKNLSSNLVIDSTLPAVSITVKGALTYLDNFKLSADSVQIDLSKIVEAGTYEIPVRISLPQSVSLVSKSDDKITLEVSKVQTLFESGENTDSEGLQAADSSQQTTDGNQQ